ncbi:ZIP family metal transporter [Sulfurovum sp. ST-21]|uniref:ZIP family metal transporter n=1 Tax=Sulfurovum indicum TaxID=2779528 RepID=A0A7M1S2X8_9BACT|nr:ZIP family metal transporter [Sulfurovum indicum]QOR61402.1 ZIP family metal transporter [Sulfurovum indicum]
MEFLYNLPVIWQGTIAGIFIGLMTLAGVIPLLFFKHIDQKKQDLMLGMSGGIMLAATTFSLLLPALEESIKVFSLSPFWTVTIVSVSMMAGIGLIKIVSRYFNFENYIHTQTNISNDFANKVWIFIFAITLHNFPEGMAVGMGYGQEDTHKAVSLTIGIGLQDIPEGLAVGLALLSIGYSKKIAALGIAISGIVETFSALLGILTVSFISFILPIGLAFAAGAMFYVIIYEIIPDIQKHNNKDLAVNSLFAGFILMMYLDVILG